MGRRLSSAAAAVVAAGFLGTGFVATVASPASAGGSAAAGDQPRWVKHVQTYPGGISDSVRVQASAEVAQMQAAQPSASSSAAYASDGNLQMNSRDSDPPVPQNETAVATSLDDPDVAVSASNDYVNGGVAVMRTLNGGRSWSTNYVVPRFGGTGDYCTGGDPSVAYSARDHVFFLSQLCFFRALPFSEVQVFVSTDNGFSWTPGARSARAATNFDYATGEVNDAVFNDKEFIAVDNSPTSPHFGRLYVTYTKFHMLPSGFSDYCPIQLSYTDSVDLTVPSRTTFVHDSVQPDDPGGKGTGRSANQFSYPVVQPDGTLDIGFVQEQCNTSYDPHLLFQRSTTGGQTFLPRAVRIDKPGQYQDNKHRDDSLPPTSFRAPNTISMTYNRGVLTYVYQNNIDSAGSQANISYQQSTDGGRHWSDMRWLSTTAVGAPAPNDQFFPSIASIGNGQLYAIWYDRRLDPANHDIDTFEARSADNGVTWTNHRISTQSWNPDKAFFSSGAFIGDYIQVAVSDTYVYPTWADARNSAYNRTGIGETDIFTDVEPR